MSRCACRIIGCFYSHSGLMFNRRDSRLKRVNFYW